MVNPTIIGGETRVPKQRISSERMQTIGYMYFAASPRSLFVTVLLCPANNGGVNHKSVVSDDFSF